MFANGNVNFVLNSLLALIFTRSVVSFMKSTWIQIFGLFIVKSAVALVLGGFVGHVHQYIESQNALQIAQDLTARMDDNSLLKEEWKDVKQENLFLLHEVNDRNSNEAAPTRTNEELFDDLMEEKHNGEKLVRDRDLADEENQHPKKKIEELNDELIQKAKEVENLIEQLANKQKECDMQRKQLEELHAQAEDNDFYHGYLEEKVKAHEAERKRLIEAATKLEERLPASQREVSVLEGNRNVEKNHGKEAHKDLGLQKKVHILEGTLQNEKVKKKLVKRERKVTVFNNSIANEKPKNYYLIEENKAKGNIFCKLGQLEEASECFLRVLDMDDDQVDCRIKLGLCLLLLGRHSEAIVQLEALHDRKDLVAAAKALQRMQHHGCPYYILGIAEDATLKEIEWAYKKRALKFNPDKCQGSNKEQERTKEIMQKVENAKDLLCDADQRQEYDALRKLIKDLADKVF